MRPSLFVALLALAGCGNKDNGNQQDLSMPDDLATADDLSVKTTCNLTGQDCGAGMKCVMDVSGTKTVGRCVTNGTKTESQSCTYDNSNMNLFNDDCAAGLTCDGFGTGNDNTTLCRKYCNKDSDCTTSGQRCYGFDVGIGWCVPTCTPFPSTGCPGGSDCGSSLYDVSATMAAPTGFFICKQTGAGAVFASCMRDSDCGSGLWCDSAGMTATNTCLGLCDGSGSHNCATPPPDAGIMTLCTAFSDQSGKGYCAAQ